MRSPCWSALPLQASVLLWASPCHTLGLKAALVLRFHGPYLVGHQFVFVAHLSPTSFCVFLSHCCASCLDFPPSFPTGSPTCSVLCIKGPKRQRTKPVTRPARSPRAWPLSSVITSFPCSLTVLPRHLEPTFRILTLFFSDTVPLLILA